MRLKLLPILMAAALAVGGIGCSQLKASVTDYDKLVRESLARDYSFAADLEYDGTAASAKVVKTGVANLRVDFSKPEALEGLAVITTENEIKVEYRGVNLDLSAYDLPAQSILPLLREVLAGEKAGKLQVKADDTTVTASGTVVLTNYQIIFEKESMKIQKILIPSVNGTVTVSEFTYLETK